MKAAVESREAMMKDSNIPGYRMNIDYNVKTGFDEHNFCCDAAGMLYRGFKSF